MIAEERHQRILGLLKRQNIVTISEIVRDCQTSEITARRDLDYLKSLNKIKRVRGGAMINAQQTVQETPNNINQLDLNERFFRQSTEQRTEKETIGRYAASLIQDGEIVLIDGGSTGLEIAKHLVGKKDVTAVVTAINIAEELEGREGVTTILTGGTLRSRTTSLLNPLLKHTLSQIYADKVFIGVRGISTTHGFTTNDFAEAEVKKLLLKAAKNVFVVADCTKFNEIAAAQIGHNDEAHYIITDSGLSLDVKRQFDHFKCQILLAEGGEF